MKLKKLLFFAIGLVLFGVLIYKADREAIYKSLLVIGYQIYIPFVISITGYFFHALSWHTVFSKIEKGVRFALLFKTKLIGETVNQLIPLGMGAGDPFRALSLRSYFPIVSITASIILERTMYFFVSIISIYVGIFILFIRIQVPKEIKLILISASVIISGLFIFFVIKQRRYFLSWLLSLIERTRLIRIRKYWKDKALDVDETLHSYYVNNKKSFFIACIYSFIGRFEGTLEIYSIMWLLGFNGGIVEAYLIHAVTQIVNLTFSIVPATFGIMEGAYGLMFHLLGYNPTDGITLQIVRRIRVFMLIALGLILGLVTKKRKHA